MRVNIAIITTTAAASSGSTIGLELCIVIKYISERDRNSKHAVHSECSRLGPGDQEDQRVLQRGGYRWKLPLADRRARYCRNP